MDKPNYQEREASYLAASENVARERVQYSREWQRSRRIANSDMQATQMTIETTADTLTMAIANQRIMEWRLRSDNTC